MAEPGLIEAYLRELRYSVERLPDVDDIVDEANDHLLEAVSRLLAAGRSRAEAEGEAVARFGSASLVARVFVKEQRKGSAVSTALTRRAGFAAAATPLLLAVGVGIDSTIDRGAVHGIGVFLMVAALGSFVFGLWGLRLRHGGLGRMGRISFWLTVASPFIAAPFGWSAGAAWLVVMSVVLVLVSIGMLRAQVLPVVPIVLFVVGPPAMIVLAIGITVLGGNADTYAGLPLLSTFVGYAWLGWAMWREPALDSSASRPSPLATA